VERRVKEDTETYSSKFSVECKAICEKVSENISQCSLDSCLGTTVAILVIPGVSPLFWDAVRKNEIGPGLEKCLRFIKYFDTDTVVFCVCISYKYLVLSEKGMSPFPVLWDGA